MRQLEGQVPTFSQPLTGGSIRTKIISMSEKKVSNNQRQVFLINPRFQTRIMGLMMIPVLVNTLIMVAMSRFLLTALRANIQNFLTIDEQLFDAMGAAQSRTISLTFMAMGLMSIFFFALWAMILSHRIAGPLHRLREELRLARDSGRFRPIQFRKGDYFQEIPTAYNEAIPSLMRGRE